MARKVFISFLGTNNYIECHYRDGEYVSPPVRFIQEALIRENCLNWTADDRILIFCTKDAEQKNWLDGGQPHASTEVEREGLQHRLEKLRAEAQGLKASVEMVPIKEGFSEADVWEIFSTVYAQLQAEDHIIFDVTHALRSIPIFSVVLFNYAKFMKGTSIMSIKYGAFEALGYPADVRQMPLEERVAPILDLTNIARLQEYNQLASNLKDFGKVKSIKDVLAYSEGQPSDDVIRDLSKSIGELDEYIATIDLRKLKCGAFIKRFRDSFRFITRKRHILAPVMNILHELNEETQDFVAEDSFQNIEAAVNWTIKHDMLMQAYPLAEEYVIMRVAALYSDYRPRELPAKKYRQFISSMLGMPAEDFSLRRWKDLLAQFPDTADTLADEPFVIRLRPLYDRVRQMRNSLAHGNGAVTYVELKEGITDIVRCIAFVNPDYMQLSSTPQFPSA